MQVGANVYFNLQNYPNNFKTQDSQQSFGEIESQSTSSDTIAQEELGQNTDITTPESPNGEKLDASEQQYVRELAAIDANVRAHEAAHIGAGAGVVSGGASFGYTRGPDGKMYATSGEVPISIKEGRTPEETISNARQVISAAMAPADPSPQDYKVAASAAQMESQAKSEQARERAEEMKGQLESKETQDSKESDSNLTSTKDFESKNNDIASQSQNNSNQEKKSLNRLARLEPATYAMKIYTANAADHSFIPTLDIAG